VSSLNIRIKFSQKHKIRIRIFRHKFSAAAKIIKHFVIIKSPDELISLNGPNNFKFK